MALAIVLAKLWDHDFVALSLKRIYGHSVLVQLLLGNTSKEREQSSLCRGEHLWNSLQDTNSRDSLSWDDSVSHAVTYWVDSIRELEGRNICG